MNSTDKNTVGGCEHLIASLKSGLPRGETPELVSELIYVHLRNLKSIPHFPGKIRLLANMTSLIGLYPYIP